MGLETFPLLDAFQESGACPFCRLAEKLEQSFMQEYLDELVMDYEYRGRIEKFGLCPRHLALFYAGFDKLGLALTLQSMLSTVRREMNVLKNAYSRDGAAEGVLRALKRQGQRTRVGGDALSHFEAYVNGRECVACHSLTAGIERYAATAVQAFAEDPQFKSAYETSPGLCLSHFAVVIRTARTLLRKPDFGSLFQVTVRKMERDLDQVESDLTRFVRAHDYRFSHEPGESLTAAVHDAVNLFTGLPVSGIRPGPGLRATKG